MTTPKLTAAEALSVVLPRRLGETREEAGKAACAELRSLGFMVVAVPPKVSELVLAEARDLLRDGCYPDELRPLADWLRDVAKEG